MTIPRPAGCDPVSDFPTIDDYAIIGDCRTAALVARSGAIEWLCLPDISSPSMFAAILDRREGGSFTLSPETPHVCERRYLPDTAILETIYRTSSGDARVLDFMPVGDGDHRWAAGFRPQRELVRIVEGLSGCVPFTAVVDPRPDYGLARAAFSKRAGFGWVVAGQGWLLTVRTDFEVERAEDPSRLVASTALVAGERRTISLSFTKSEVGVQPVIGAPAWRELETSSTWWRRWVGQCIYAGENRDLVMRSAITLKLLTYSLSGAVVAAATTSLPESIAASRNWDYRFCWLRDASVTMRAFLGLGLHQEAAAFLEWLLNATRLTRPELRILYDLHGRNDGREKVLDHLTGYRNSRPVRIGNAAGSQLQLDTYGSVIIAACEYIHTVGPLQGGEMRLLRDFGDVICRRWQEPDHGLWEVRGEPRQFTATKVMCWVGLDRLVRLAEAGLVKTSLERFRANRDALRASIEEHGYSDDLGAYVAELDSGADGSPDAAVLLMAPVGYGEADSHRLRSTLRWITARLGRDGLYARYPTGFDGDPSREGAFGICAAWAVETMVRLGDVDGARATLGRLAQTANDVGLFAEEYDAEANASLGNFPQAFSHAGFVAAALALERASEPSRCR